MSDLSSIQQDVTRITNLINETNSLLQSPVSSLSDNLSGYLERNASKLAAPLSIQLRKLASTHRWDVIVAGSLILGTAYIGAKAIDGVRNAVAETKAKEKLNAYYQMLSVKQNVLIEEQQKIIFRLSDDIDMLEDDRKTLRNTLTLLAETLQKVQAASVKKNA